MEGRISSRLLSMKFHLCNVCVDADPVALLTISVPDGGMDRKLEEFVDVAKTDEMTFAFVPHEGTDLEMIVPAIGKAHPEFKTEFALFKKSAGSDETVPILVVKVPPVDEHRKDILEKAVGTCKDAYCTYVDGEVNVTKVKMAPYLPNASKEDQDAVGQILKDKAKTYKDMAEEAAGEKIKKIGEAYQKWLEEKAANDSKLQDLASAANPEAAKSMSME